MIGKMKAVRMYAPKDLRLEEVQIPQIRGDEVLLKVMAVGICGSDIPRVNELGAYISPITPGHEFSGQVYELGNDVDRFKIGDRVTAAPLMPCLKCEFCDAGHYSLCRDYSYFGSRCDGAFAQYIAVPQANLLKIEESVSFAAAATADPLANALHAIKRGGFKEGDSVCVFGTGPIELYILQYVAAKGASKVIAIDIDEKKLEAASKNGAQICLNGLDKDIVEQIRNVTNDGADLVIDASGVPSAQHNAIMATAKLGKMVLLGISHKGLNLSEEAVNKIMRGEQAVIGSWNSFSKPFPGWEWTHGVASMAEGVIDAEKIITHKLRLEDVAETFRKIDRQEMFYNKILFFPWED